MEITVTADRFTQQQQQQQQKEQKREKNQREGGLDQGSFPVIKTSRSIG
jgi:hypothetical protein